MRRIVYVCRTTVGIRMALKASLTGQPIKVCLKSMCGCVTSTTMAKRNPGSLRSSANFLLGRHSRHGNLGVGECFAVVIWKKADLWCIEAFVLHLGVCPVK